MEVESAGGRLLVLDDDADVNATICAIGETAGFESKSCVSAEEGIGAVDDWNPTHIVIDLAMPDVDGVAAMRRLAAKGYKGAIIVVSGLGTRVIEAAARAASENGLRVAGVLAKPFSPNGLRAILTANGATSEGAKKVGRQTNRARVFGVTVESLKSALVLDQFNVYFQPKISCATGEVVGFEGLVRWVHPEYGIIPPDRFIPLAEGSGLIDQLTIQIFEKAIPWFAEWFGDKSLSLSLNISPRVLADASFPPWVLEECKLYKVDPRRITLEITETSSMQEPVKLLEYLTQFRIVGFNISIDDFGVGYSSLVQLARLPFSELKIDKEFVIGILTSEESQKIATAIVGLADALGLRVTAEGVEDDWALAFLRNIGCDYAQGYLIARPMAMDDVLDWLDNWTPESAFRGAA